MKEIEKLLKENYTELDKIEEVLSALTIVNSPSYPNTIYNKDFTLRVLKSIINNKMDIDSVLVALYYCLLRGWHYDIDTITNTAIKNKVNSLYAIKKLEISTKESQELSINKIIISMAKDFSAIIIKLFIEVEKLSVIDNYGEKEKKKLMKSYRDMYAPIASMLGFSKIKDTMEDAVLKYYYPKFYDELKDAVDTYISQGKDKIDEAVNRIKTELQPIIPNVKVYGRQKKLASIAKKLQNKNMKVDSIKSIYGDSTTLEDAMEEQSFKNVKLYQIVDILALRILVNTVEECYMVLGKVFSLFTPIGNFKDYISHPKENGYQSLHTLVMLDNGKPLEIQIRTFSMHTFAEYGLASHWAYKQKISVQNDDAKINYVRQIIDYLKDKPLSVITDAINSDFYNGMIYVQTPLGKIMELPEGSTPIDFAYAVHSNIGNKCSGAKVNGKMVPVNSILKNGDMVQILTNPNSKGPSRDWLKFVKSQSTKSKINAFFKKEMKDENIKKGKSMLEEQAKATNVNLPKLLDEKYLSYVFNKYKLTSLEDMYASIGYGGLTTVQVLNLLTQVYNKIEGVTKDKSPLIRANKTYKQERAVEVMGHPEVMVKYGMCCKPIPGDDIVGYVSRGSGVTIHRTNCHEVINCEPERLVSCNWLNTENVNFVSKIVIIIEDKSGALATLSKKISDLKINMLGISSRRTSDGLVLLNLQIEVKEKDQIDELIQKLNNFSFVREIYRS